MGFLKQIGRVWFLGWTVLLAWPGTLGPRSAVGAPPTTRRSELPVLVAVAKPSKTAVLSALQAGRIAEITVTEGQFVPAGEVVCRLDDRVQQVRTAITKLDAETPLEEELSKARWEKADRNLQRLMALHGNDFASSKELSDARADAEITRLEFEQAKQRRVQARLAHQREEAILEQFQLKAPFPAYVSAVHRQVGETVELGEDMVTLVQLNPLEVIVDCPLAGLDAIQSAQRAMLTPADEFWPPRVGVVQWVSRVADPASQTVRVSFSVANEDGLWISGLKVHVRLNRDAEVERPVLNQGGLTDENSLLLENRQR